MVSADRSGARLMWAAVCGLGLMLLGMAGGAQAAQGDATWYTYTGGGNCSFPLPEGIYTVAMNAEDYQGSKACGGMIKVTNPANGLTVLARVDNQCPECLKGDVDLSAEAFAQIADPTLGRIPVSWKYLANDVPTIKLYFKEGSSQWWTAVQVRDHRYRIKSLAYRLTGSGNAFVAVPRETYNYFVKADGMGLGPYDFKMVDVNGQVIKATNISLTLTTELDTGKQFPAVETSAVGP